MQTSLYKISLKDGSMFNIFCANKKQNKDMLSLITKMQAKDIIKRNGIIVTEKGIHTMKQFNDIIINLKLK